MGASLGYQHRKLKYIVKFKMIYKKNLINKSKAVCLGFFSVFLFFFLFFFFCFFFFFFFFFQTLSVNNNRVSQV